MSSEESEHASLLRHGGRYEFQQSNPRCSRRLRPVFFALLLVAVISCASLAAVLGAKGSKWRQEAADARAAAVADVCNTAGALPAALPQGLYKANLQRVGEVLTVFFTARPPSVTPPAILLALPLALPLSLVAHEVPLLEIVNISE